MDESKNGVSAPKPAAHTPGPWIANGGEIGTLERRPGTDWPLYVIASVGCSRHAPPVAQSVADARLIAAAPELLAACEALVSECESLGRASHTSARIEAAHRAIAAARGVAR